MTNIAVCGASGRVGQRIIALAADDPSVHVVAALASPASAGREVAGFSLATELPINLRIDAVIDFSTPAGTMAVLKTCVERKIPILVATTGFTRDQRAEIDAAAHLTAVLLASNTSLVVNVLFSLVRKAGTLLRDRGFDLEVIERHHRLKADAPSGTALQLAATLQEAVGTMDLQHGRSGHTGLRPDRQIGLHALRVGDNVGEHTVVFGGIGESLELTQRATSRDCYARGALQAATFLVGRPAGSYSMADVLGIA